MIMCSWSATLVETPLKNCWPGQHLLQNEGAQHPRQWNDQALLAPFERSTLLGGVVTYAPPVVEPSVSRQVASS